LYRIAVITPLNKEDYLANTILDGLISLQNEGNNLEFFISSLYPSRRIPIKKELILTRKEFIGFANQADIIFLIWGKDNTDFSLARKIGRWEKTVFIDGSEPGNNMRLDKEVQSRMLNLSYKGSGAIYREMLEKCALYFRREKPYINGIVPLPFGIDSAYTRYCGTNKGKDIDFACVFGQEEYPALRRKVRERLEQFCQKNQFTYFARRTNNTDEFYEVLSRTKVGISVSGGGFDTARFWEILGNQCLLLTDKIDIFRMEDGALNYKRIFEFENINDFEIVLNKVASFLRNGYNQNELDKEFKDILSRHSSKARVLTVLNRAKEKNILKGSLAKVIN